jgi:ABC-type nitrate/sulfonate/bicarbonate transport system substrate-binding protein
MTRKKLGLVFAICSAIICSLLIALPRCAPGKRGEIVIAANIAKTTLLLYVADAHRLFETNGLAATVKMHQSGPLSLKELEERRADVACVADFAFVTKSFKTGNLKVIGAIARSVGAHIIVRRDSGITKPADLVGKAVALPKGTIAEFFLGAYCQRNGVPYQTLHIVYLPPADMVEAIRKGTVNAACVWSPFIERIKG